MPWPAAPPTPLVGNPPGTGALEIAYQGPTLAVEADSVRVAFAGGAAAIEVLAERRASSGTRLPPLQSVRLRRGAGAAHRRPLRKRVGYLAVEGGFDAAPALGSQSTYARAGLGGFDGRALRAGDQPAAAAGAGRGARGAAAARRSTWRLPGRFRVVLGPQDDYFSERAGGPCWRASLHRVGRRRTAWACAWTGRRWSTARASTSSPMASRPAPSRCPATACRSCSSPTGRRPAATPRSPPSSPPICRALGRLAPGAKVAFEAVSIEAAEAAHRQLRRRARRLCPSRIVAVRAARHGRRGRAAGRKSRQRRDQCARSAVGAALKPSNMLDQRALIPHTTRSRPAS